MLYHRDPDSHLTTAQPPKGTTGCCLSCGEAEPATMDHPMGSYDYDCLSEARTRVTTWAVR